ncbi:ornithine cyclodeaminase, mu-crystallin [Halogeometricum borinquense DSM 11551]|uniref:Ornithine cyclodeaminase, mu-crystallin n=2 Tax=Halogeometricum borinquense TaxID=60847 RepID=E4NTH2_HALBP|nr:ornithine cyclodeaminase family protein [Halogeometricum borinquense]ADQ65917.1 predicted ornithine cyclodeaminase, mu-crystallin [Halogeometricum borinquense DSM 11551]ELY26275.1 ornithine cyclodeaminase, mu-crystallin [Halogeometricum borinquense DSM 11551]RYJ14190.1 ornithine cyclodeaminase family protein [Halogeometricum borinquense]
MADVRVLSDEQVASLLSLSDLLPEIERAFLKQGRGEVERPPRPHYPVGTETPGTALTMPAYVHGDPTYATKLAAVHESNAEKGLPTVNAQIAVTDAETGLPRAYLAGTRVTNARTGCIGGLAARELADAPVRLGVFGAGAQARWQTRAIASATNLERVRIYAPSESRAQCASDLRERLSDVAVSAVESPDPVLDGSNVVVTATTSTEPVFDGARLEPGTLVVAIGAFTESMRELDSETVRRASRLFADVPEEVAETGDFAYVGVDATDLTPFSDVFEAGTGRENDAEIVVVASVGSAVLDAVTAGYLYERAETDGVGTVVEL